MALTRSDAGAEDVGQMHARIEDLQAALDAIRQGGVDAVVTGPPGYEQVYTLTSADRPYRLILQVMNEGAVTVSEHGLVLFVNPKFAQMVGHARAALVGTSLFDAVVADDRPTLATLLATAPGEQSAAEIGLHGAQGPVPALLAASCLDLEGSPVICLVATDLTHQKEVEASLRASERQQVQHAAEIEKLNATLEHTVQQRTAELARALADLEAESAARMRHAREVNDSIVQVLVAAEMAADLGHGDESHHLLIEASRAARAWIDQQLHDVGAIKPGTFVRDRPASEPTHHHGEDAS